MTTTYRIRHGNRIIRTQSPHAAAEASRDGARVTAQSTAGGEAE